MKIKALISNCCESSVIENTDICSKCGEHCKPEKESLEEESLGKIKNRDRLLEVIKENYDLAKKGCALTNKELAEKFQKEKRIVSSERISYLLKELIARHKIEITHLGGPNGKIVRLSGLNKANKVFSKKLKNNS